MATTFHPFPRLPPELRAQIWRLAASPRMVHITTTPTPIISQFNHTSPTPPPALRNVCKESRQHAAYQKAFFTTLPGESEARYIWINFQEDMVWLADFQVERLAHKADIRRFRLTVPNGYLGDMFYSYYFHNRVKIMREFTALRELHLAIGEGFSVWGTTAGGVGYECPANNVKYLDLHTGLLLTGPQLEMAHEWCEHRGGKVYDMDDFDEELRWMLDHHNGLKLSELAEID